jgi:hypothetical protein
MAPRSALRIWDLDPRSLDRYLEDERVVPQLPRREEDERLAANTCTTAYTPGIINCVRGFPPRPPSTPPRPPKKVR